MAINGKLRAFIAVPLSEEALQGLQSGQDIIKDTGVVAGFPRVSSAHITLKFLGEINRDQVSLITKKLEENAAGFEPFVLRIKGLGAFPSIKNPRITWAGIESEGHLFRLQRRVEDAMREAGFEVENRRFSPHITLARIKSPLNTDLLEAALKQTKNLNMGISPVCTIRFYESILNPGGAVHKILSEIHSGSWK